MASKRKATRITLNPVTNDTSVGDYIQSTVNIIETRSNIKKYKANRRHNKYFFDKRLKACVNKQCDKSVLKTDEVKLANEVTSKSVNEPSKILKNFIEKVDYVDVNDNNDSNSNGMYVGGKMYPDHVLKDKTDPLDVVLHKVTEIHRRITKNCKKMKAFECKICEFSFLSIEDLYKHLKFKHSIDMIKFIHIEYLSRIVLMICKHRFQNKCPKCEIAFQNSAILKQHRMRTSFQCRQCKKDYNDCLKWKKHITLCDSETYAMCDFEIEYPNYTHYDTNDDSCKVSGPMAYFCVVCHMLFQDMVNLSKHQKSFHPEQLGQEVTFPISTCWTCNIKYVGNGEQHSCKDFFKCPICLKLFDSEILRDDHLNAPKTSDASCAICKKLFVTNCENLMHDCNKDYIPSALFICKICNKSHTSCDEMYRHVKSRHVKYFLSVNDHIPMNSNDVNQKEYIKGKITTSQEKINLIGKKKSCYINNRQKYKDLCITTYAKKKIVFNKAETRKKYDLVKRKSYLEEVIDIENKEIRDLNIERELMKEAERKRKHLQKSTNEIKTEIIGSFNEEDYQVYHYENKQPNELDSVKIENTDGTQVKGSFICSGVKNLEETETFIGKSLKKVLERLDFNANKNLSISHNSVEGCTQKILDTVLKEENMNNEIGNRQILCKTIINEKLRCPITDLKIAMKTEPIIELIDDDLAKGKNDLAIDMNIKIEEENVMDKPREIMDNLKEIRGGSVIGDNSNISHCAHQHPSHNHLRNIEGIENTQKGGNGTFLEEIPLGEVRIADDLDDKVNATFIYRSPKRNTNTTPKEKIIDFKEKNTESMQNYIDNDKLTINSSSLIDVKNEIKREPLEECFERDMVTISNDSVQQLSIASMMDAMDTKSEVNDGSVAEESNIDIEVLTILPEVCKMEEETFECGTFGYETYEIHEKCIMENELSLDKEQDILLDAKHISLKTEIKCIDPDIMKQKYDCRVCVRTFNTLAAYYDHYICHNLSKYQCPYCKVIVDMEKFYHHCFTHVILNYHKSIAIDQSSNVKCKQCDEKIQKEYLLAHYEWHILVKGKPIVMVFPKTLLNTIIEDLRRKESLCVLCERNFIDLKGHLIEHLYANAHADKNENGGLSCQICKKLLCNKYAFKKHILGHTSSPAYECKICNRTYKRRFRFIYHQKKHKSACVWCDNCEGKFTTKEDLIHHLKEKHRTARVIRCEICKIVYRSQSLLDDHVKIIHVEDNVFPSISQVKKPLITYGRSSKSRLFQEMEMSANDAIMKRGCSMQLMGSQSAILQT